MFLAYKSIFLGMWAMHVAWHRSSFFVSGSSGSRLESISLVCCVAQGNAHFRFLLVYIGSL